MTCGHEERVPRPDGLPGTRCLVCLRDARRRYMLRKRERARAERDMTALSPARRLAIYESRIRTLVSIVGEEALDMAWPSLTIFAPLALPATTRRALEGAAAGPR